MLDQIIYKINPENKDLSLLSKEEMFDLLCKLNRILRGLDETEKVVSDNMSVGDLVAPTREIQMAIFDYLVQNMKNVPDEKARAAMVYYTLLNLHMFSNGNGRTSRFIYDYIAGDLSEDNISYYFHKKSNYTNHPKNDLENAKNILDIYIVNQIPDEFLSEQLGFIPQEVLDNFFWITVGHSNRSPFTDTILPPSVLEKLSQKELEDLDTILKDGYSMKLCPSGLAMLFVAIRKGELSKWITKYNEDLLQGIGMKGRLNFSIYTNPELIADWTLDDFKEIIAIGNKVKYLRLKCVIDIFVSPEKYINKDSGNPYVDDILKRGKKQSSEHSFH